MALCPFTRTFALRISRRFISVTISRTRWDSTLKLYLNSDWFSTQSNQGFDPSDNACTNAAVENKIFLHLQLRVVCAIDQIPLLFILIIHCTIFQDDIESCPPRISIFAYPLPSHHSHTSNRLFESTKLIQAVIGYELNTESSNKSRLDTKESFRHW